MASNQQPHVFVGMSGGVDSSLAAALLVEQGYRVTGVYMKNWTDDLPGMVCPWAEDLADAKRVAVTVGIPLKVYDFTAEYKHKVVDYMIAEYQAGRTPNPDIMCNQEVKFKLFLEAAMADGADLIATGHYATVKDGRLLMAADATKDQTYFLCRMPREALAKTLFPLGNLQKTAVRQMAAERGLVTAEKPDSQGICFVGQVGIRDFLSQYVSVEPGPIVDKRSGKTIGRHDGAIFYTIGQRQGLGLGGGLPYYVTGKDMAANMVFVTTDLNDGTLWRSVITANDARWLDDAPADGANVTVRLRHRGALIPAMITGGAAGSLAVRLSEPERAVTPGQTIAFYDHGRVQGSAIIC